MQAKIMIFLSIFGSIVAIFTVGKFAIQNHAGLFESFAFALVIFATGILTINRIGELYDNKTND